MMEKNMKKSIYIFFFFKKEALHRLPPPFIQCAPHTCMHFSHLPGSCRHLCLFLRCLLHPSLHCIMCQGILEQVCGSEYADFLFCKDLRTAGGNTSLMATPHKALFFACLRVISWACNLSHHYTCAIFTYLCPSLLGPWRVSPVHPIIYPLLLSPNHSEVPICTFPPQVSRSPASLLILSPGVSE